MKNIKNLNVVLLNLFLIGRSKLMKTSSIILRVSDIEHSIIQNKSILFNKKKSDYLRHCALFYWNDITDYSSFRKLLSLYKNGDELKKKEIVEILFQYYRKNGFPYVHLNEEQREERLKRVIKAKNILLDNNTLQFNAQGLDLANSYHPHMMTAYYSRGEKSPYQTFSDDDSLRDCINRWMELEKNPSPTGIRRILKTRDRTKAVSNHRPTIAKYIYDKYVPENGSVLDPCAGYGGRLIGCIASNKNILYHGIDPNSETAIGNMKIAGEFNKQYDMFGERIYKYRYRFDLDCAEKVMPLLNDKYDLVFSSSPYFDVEIYSDNLNQSSSQYPEYQKWLENFLYIIVNESIRLLKENGRIILNIKNTPKYKMADDLCKYCELKGLILEEIYQMRLSNSDYNLSKGNVFHTEPIFVFKK